MDDKPKSLSEILKVPRPDRYEGWTFHISPTQHMYCVGIGVEVYTTPQAAVECAERTFHPYLCREEASGSVRNCGRFYSGATGKVLTLQYMGYELQQFVTDCTEEALNAVALLGRKVPAAALEALAAKRFWLTEMISEAELKSTLSKAKWACYLQEESFLRATGVRPNQIKLQLLQGEELRTTLRELALVKALEATYDEVNYHRLSSDPYRAALPATVYARAALDPRMDISAATKQLHQEHNQHLLDLMEGCSSPLIRLESWKPCRECSKYLADGGADEEKYLEMLKHHGTGVALRAAMTPANDEVDDQPN